ncbi:protein S40-5 [Cornus florida]|uniref:protein S40-5 n=1 Tax=Cornus florida TaxID=4283 RepID=UPI00289E62EA|nr:protein S40-5 [Cornus florida]
MAKGRKLTTSRSERLLGSYSHGHGQGAVTEGSELGEEDVWSMVDDMVNGDDHSMNGSHSEWSPRDTPESNGGVSVRSRRGVSREDRHVGGLSLAFDNSGKTASSRIVHQYRSQDSLASPRGLHMAASAPMNVPDWSKIYRVDSVESLHDSDDGMDDRESEMVPPHEYLAYARSRNSVFEGVGRTLKGRDMSRVRDAVWSQTGFDG